METFTRDILPAPAVQKAGAEPTKPVIPFLDSEGNIKTLAQIEKEAISLAIACLSPNPNLSEVARKLGMGRSTLYRKIADYGLCPRPDK